MGPGSTVGDPGVTGDSGVTAPASVKGLCTRGGLCQLVSTEDRDKVDLLFMIDNSDSMGEEQSKLRDQIPHLVTVLTSGVRDDDPSHNFPAVKDIHLGVVTSDMGLPGVDGIVNCQGLGQDGIMQNHPAATFGSCQASYPPFLSFNASLGSQPAQAAADFQCLTVVGTGGCGYEHQLEAPLKALWPSVDPMANLTGGKNRILFLPDPTTGKGALGHGDVENAGFLRNDPVSGLSLIAIILLTDEDDCSAADTRPFTPPMYLDPNDPLVMEGMQVRCHYNRTALYPTERYVLGFKALRPGNENTVFFAAIAGVPADLVDANVVAATNWSDAAQRDQFYDTILKDQRMQETVLTQGTPDVSDDKLQHSCNAANGGTADPPNRIVQVARGFGANGMVQSICQDDYAPALDTLSARMASELGARCLPQGISRNKQGLTSCDVMWLLPPPGKAPASTPTDCNSPPGFGFVLPPRKGVQTVAADGGAICRVAQLAVEADPRTNTLAPVATVIDGATFSEGWYYDDFSDELAQCRAGARHRVAFTTNAKPPPGVTVALDCAR
jgi:hypothetical protein